MREITLDQFKVYLEQGIKPSTVKKALDRAGIIVENDAKMRCPVGKTGVLRNSIEHRVENSGWENACYVGTPVEYAP